MNCLLFSTVEERTKGYGLPVRREMLIKPARKPVWPLPGASGVPTPSSVSTAAKPQGYLAKQQGLLGIHT